MATHREIGFGDQTVEQHKALLATEVAANDIGSITGLIDALVATSTSLPLSAAVLEALPGIVDPLENEALTRVLTHALSAMHPRINSFHKADYAVRTLLQDVQVACGDTLSAAYTLVAMDIDARAIGATDEEKVGHHVRIAELFLDAGSANEADRALNKVVSQIDRVADKGLRTRYSYAYARVVDAKRRFEDAALRYHRLSLNTDTLSEADARKVLSAAVVCTILAKAGPRRTHVQGLLMRDERTAQTQFFSLLARMVRGRLLAREEVEPLKRGLLPHQEEQVSFGMTVLDKAVLEHNVQATSRLFRNVSLVRLGALIGTTTDNAERVTAGMVEEKRLHALIDEGAGVVHFQQQGTMLEVWDARIRDACTAANSCAEEIEERFPELA